MWSSLLLSLLLAGPPAGVVAGKIIAPEGMTISKPMQVVLVPPDYLDLWNSEVQKRLDDYWERYKPLFASNKQYFTEVSAMAYAEALRYLLGKMQADSRINIAQFVHSSGADASFEFRNVPAGEYALVAAGVFGVKEYVWHEAFEVTTAAPLFISLKTHVP